MARFLRHVGKNHLGSKVIIVFRELPDDANYCLCVESASLSDMYHDNMMRVIESNAAQATVNLFEVLGRNNFGDGQQMLTALHGRGLLKKYSVDQVIVEPMPNRTAPLREVNKQIAAGTAPKAPVVAESNTGLGDVAVAVVNSPVLVDKQPAVANKPVESSEAQRKSSAESKLLQARLMEEDAQKLRREAYELDPELKKGGRPSKKQTEKVEEVGTQSAE